jgi:hypothetical protein
MYQRQFSRQTDSDVCTGDDFGGADLRKGLPGVSGLDQDEFIVAFA